ncbi:MAG: FAD-dependent oxidoreductase [Salinirussus sp.]
MQTSADVTVVGAGMAGLVAGIEAAEAGADVIVIEKAPRPGGSMYLSGGIVWTHESMEEMRARVPDGDERLQQLVLESLPAGFEWLRDHGVRLREPESDYSALAAQIDPIAATETLVDQLEEAGGTLTTETPMEGLRTAEDGRIDGVTARQGEKTIEIDATATIIATGGFQGNEELLQRYVTEHTARCWLRSNPWSTGDGLTAAMEAGAKLTDGLGTFYGHSLPAPPAEFDLTELVEVTQYQGPWAVVLNESGHRFVDESLSESEEHIAQATAKRATGRAYFVIDDALYRSQTSTNKPIRHIVDAAAEAGGRVASAHSLDELGDALTEWGVNGTTAVQTIREFNDHVRSGRMDALDPPRQAHRFTIDEPPFRVVEVAPGLTFTMGGVDVTEEMAVVRRTASTATVRHYPTDPAGTATVPIEGLFAAGVDIGNVNHRFYMGGLSLALVSGMIAGENAAEVASLGG